MGIMGFSQLPINVSSTTAWGMSRLRVALVLDNTGSMSSSGKMTALKKASHNLLTQLQNAVSKNGDVYVSIIPFSKDVNVGGPTNYNANWIDWEEWDADNGHDESTTTCTTTVTGKSGKKKKKCTTSTTWVPDNHNTWNGCVTDRDQDYDTTNTPPNPADASLPPSIPSTLFPAEQYGSCPVELMPLSYNWTQLNKKIDDMTPKGNTNQTIGLQWGFQALTANSPLPVPPLDPNYQYQQVVILLTDGLNTENRWTSTASQIDARTKKVCDNIKKAGITIYAVLVMAGNSNLLQSCASDPSKYFMLTSADQIITTFDKIGTALSQLRVAK
jgi:uncharacterized protein YegL